MRFDFAAATDVGRRRSENQDRYHADASLVAVADGLGGHAGGATAAELATAALAGRERIDSLDGLIRLVGEANTAIFEAARNDPSLREMSTTICALAVIGDPFTSSRLAACNVGDSRLYLLGADSSLMRLTVDHTITENLLRDGLISAAEAARHRDRHKLTRAVGYESSVHVDAWELAATDGARFLICSDGLSNEVDDSAISEELRSAGAPNAAAERLLERALHPRGGRDNVTVVVADLLDGPAPGPGAADAIVLNYRQAVPA